jgi:hypothetical protein
LLLLLLLLPGGAAVTGESGKSHAVSHPVMRHTCIRRTISTKGKSVLRGMPLCMEG